jgi:hypothetical protein
MGARGYFQANIILSPLTTYYFRAMAGGQGSVVGEEFNFTTGATPPSVSTGGATAVLANSATLHATLHSLGTATAVNVAFQYGTRPGVYTEQTASLYLTDKGDFPANLSGLQPHTTYYYRAIADGGKNGSGYGMERSFTTGSSPPFVETSAATEPTTNTAFLNGNLTGLGTAKPVNVSFIYGTTHNGPYPYATAPHVMSAPYVFQTGVTGLSPNTTYYFKARADGGIYGTSYGTELNFTTNLLPPIVDTGGAIDVMTNAAILQGDLYLMGTTDTGVDASFEYRMQGGSYNFTLAQHMTSPDSYQTQVTGLVPDTTYYYRAKGDGGASGTGEGSERAFTTGSHPPITSTADAGGITAGSAVLNGNLISVGSSLSDNVSFQYGTSHRGPYPYVTMPQAQAVRGAFQTSISGLSAYTAYYFRAVADGGIYGAGYGREMSFITSSVPPAVATGNATNITTNTARLNGSLSSLGSAALVNVSFQWGTSPASYTHETAAQAITVAGSFWADLAGLSQGTTYYFRARAVGNSATVYGDEQNFTTLTPVPPPPPPPPQPPTPTPTPPNPLIGTGMPTSHGASVPGIASTTQPVSLPIIIVQSASLSSSKVSPGTPVTVTANVSNRGTVNGSTRLKLYVNGEEDSSQGVTVESGGNRPVYFTVTRSQQGSYSVYIGGVGAGSFVVADYISPDAILLISLLLILASLLLALIYVWRGRQQEY